MSSDDAILLVRIRRSDGKYRYYVYWDSGNFVVHQENIERVQPLADESRVLHEHLLNEYGVKTLGYESEIDEEREWKF